MMDGVSLAESLLYRDVEDVQELIKTDCGTEDIRAQPKLQVRIGFEQASLYNLPARNSTSESVHFKDFCSPDDGIKIEQILHPSKRSLLQNVSDNKNGNETIKKLNNKCKKQFQKLQNQLRKYLQEGIEIESNLPDSLNKSSQYPNASGFQLCQDLTTIQSCIESLCSTTLYIIHLLKRIQEFYSVEIPIYVYSAIERPVNLIRSFQHEQRNLLYTNFDDEMISSLFEKLAGQIRAARTTLWSVYQLRNCEINDISNQLISRMVTFVLQNLLKTETNNRNRLIRFNKLSDPTSSILSKNTIDCIQNTYRQQNNGKWFMYKPFSSSSCNQPVIWSGTPIPFSQQPTLQSNSQNRDEDPSSQGRLHDLTTNHQIGPLYTHSTLIFPHTTPLSVQPALLMTSSFLPSSSSHHYYHHPPIESCNHGLLSSAFYGNSK